MTIVLNRLDDNAAVEVSLNKFLLADRSVPGRIIINGESYKEEVTLKELTALATRVTALENA